MGDFETEEYERDEIYYKALEIQRDIGGKYPVDYIRKFIIEWEALRQLFNPNFENDNVNNVK